MYSTEICPKCKRLKSHLNEMGIDFDEKDMSTPDALAELNMNGVFTMNAPVLQYNNQFFTVDELFEKGNLRTQFINDTIQ